MKAFLPCLLVCGMFSVAQAITVSWKATNSNDDVSSWYSSISNTALVYAETGSDVAFAANVALGGTVEGYSKIEDADIALPEHPTPLSGTVQLLTGGASADSGTYFVVLFNNDEKFYAVLSINAESVKDYWYVTGPGLEVQVYEGAFATGTLVPEPTALALLALGVAGLALRRKIA